MGHENRAAVIPPLSVVRIVSDDADWRDQKGRTFRVGYYRKADGLDCVWLVDDNGEYEQTADQQMLRDHFSMVELSDETDLFGEHREIIGARRSEFT